MSDDLIDRRGIDARTVVALSERVAIVETQQRALKDDTTVIRTTIHSINQDLQKLFINSQRAELSLQQLLGIKDDVDSVLANTQRTRGAWRALGIVGSALMGAVTIGAGLATTFFYLFGHLK